MELLFRAVSEDEPGATWRAHFERLWPAYREWYLVEGEGARPGYLTCRRALETHMPELVPLWERLVELAGGGDLPARMLSLYRPPPYLTGCSQAAWVRDEPALVRNYDYHPERCEGVLWRSAWRGTPVMAMNDSLWGALDGLNRHGVAITLAFGGRTVVGDGFAIPLLVRYVLETCTTTAEAVAALTRVPSHMAYSLGVVDRAGARATVHVAPDRAAEVVDSPVSTNHQGEVEWTEHAELTATVDRERVLLDHIDRADETLDRFVDRFAEPPLFSRAFHHGFGTVYTAIYRPRRGEVELRWPRRSWHQSFDRFVEGASLVRYG